MAMSEGAVAPGKSRQHTARSDSSPDRIRSDIDPLLRYQYLKRVVIFELRYSIAVVGDADLHRISIKPEST